MTGNQVLTYASWTIFAAAALQDLWRLRISNILPVLLIALFPLWVWSTGFEADLWQNVALFAFSLLAGLFLFSREWLGGGDVKLLAAAALWFDFHAAPYLMMAVAFGGGALGLLFILIRRLLPKTIAELTGWVCLKPKGPIPYGIAIAAGSIACGQLYGFNPAPPRDIGAVLAGSLDTNQTQPE